MLKLEMYKFFKRKLVLIAMAGLFVLVLLQEVHACRIYKNYQQEIAISEKYKGMYTDSRFADFWKEAVQLCDDTDLLGYKGYFFDGDRQKTAEEIFPSAKFDIYFGSSEGWNSFFYSITHDLRYIPIFIVLVFAGIFSYEDECGMQEILLSTKNGRKECSRAKLRLAFIVTNIIYIVVIFISVADMLIMTRGAGWNTSVQMITWLMDCKFDINNLAVGIHTIFLSFLSINVIILITLLSSFLLRNPVISMCVSLGILYILRIDLVSVVFDKSVVDYIVSLTPVNVLDTIHLVSLEPVMVAGMKMQWLYIVEIIYIILLVSGMAVFYKVLSNNYKYYTN